MKYRTVIGLEVHVQLLTKSKIFCSCSTTFGKRENSQACPVCLGLPGSLPVLNREVLSLGIKAALTLKCQVAPIMKFDRKNYFYPDLPKGYQISQYDMPLATGGYLDIENDDKSKRIGITRVHLEEDAGKLIHEESGSLVDFNRCGVPLVEIVSEPDINSSDEAYSYLTKLKSILKSLKISDCNMQEGSLRCDANISVTPIDSKELGVKTEIKNLNSFKAVRNALRYEADRQKKLCEDGKKITQETLLWDDNKAMTFSMRSKEEAHDYRYFPEPDLPKFKIDNELVKKIRDEISKIELPDQKHDKFMKKHGLSAYDAGVLTSNEDLTNHFERYPSVAGQVDIKHIANWLIGPVTHELSSRPEDFSNLKLKPKDLIDMINFVDMGEISGTTAKEIILPEIMNGIKSTMDIIKERDILQVSGEKELSKIIDKIIEENQKSVEDFKQGKKNAIMYLVGQAMRQTKGKANPKKVSEMLKARLEGV